MRRILSPCLSRMIPGNAGYAQGTDSANTAGHVLVRVSELPQQDWQKSVVFPDWKGYTDDTLAMNSMLSFRFSHGQGVIWLQVDEAVEAFTLYINGQKYDTTGVHGGTYAAGMTETAVDGVNTVQVSNIMPLGLNAAVRVCIPYPVVLDADRGTEGIRPEALRLISDLIVSDVEHGFPGAQLAIVRNGRLVWNEAWGYALRYAPDGKQLQEVQPAGRDTVYDLASVTKMFAANYAVQKLVTDGALNLDTPLAELLGDGFAEDTLPFTYQNAETGADHETQKAWKRELTVRDILRHQAGFPASQHYNNPDFDMALQGIGRPGSNQCYARTREDTLKAIFRTPLLYAPGTKTVYSDVDYMLLCFVIEAVTGQRLDRYMEETFYAPMGLERIGFLPLENGFAPGDCAATELNGNTRDLHVDFEGIRTYTLQGEVHDERAWYCMQGVSGHAGLFSNAADLARLASVMLTGGYGSHRFFSRNVMDMFTAPKAVEAGQWGLGWWREGDDQRAWYFGTQSAPDTVGHQGWTGTLCMVDPSRELVVAYLTNMIHSRVTDPEQLNKFDGSRFTASTLGFVPQILSIGMETDEDVSAQLLDLAADMAAESLRLIPAGTDAAHPLVRNAQSKIEVLKAWARDAGDAEKLRLADRLQEALPQE